MRTTMTDKIYFLTEGSYIKIGYTSQPIETRMHQLNTGSVHNIYLLGWLYGDKDKEKEIHKRFLKNRVRRNGEWFVPTSELLDFINENNLEPNTYIDVINNKVVKLFSLHKI